MQNRRKLLLRMLLFSLISLSACVYENQNSSHEGSCQPGSMITVQQAIRIAKEEMAKIGYEYIESEISAVWAYETWSVLFVHSSLQVGAHISVKISPDGNVLKVVGGN